MKSLRYAVGIAPFALTVTAFGLTAAIATPAVGHAKPGDCTTYEWPSAVAISTDGWVLSGRGLFKEARDFSIATVPPAVSPIMSPGMYLDGTLNVDGKAISGQLSLRGSTETLWTFDGAVGADRRATGQANGKPFTVDNPLICTAKEATAEPQTDPKPQPDPKPQTEPQAGKTATVVMATNIFNNPDGNGTEYLNAEGNPIPKQPGQVQLVEPELCRSNWCHVVAPEVPGDAWIYIGDGMGTFP